MAKDYAAMDKAALEAAIMRLKADFEDLKETMEFNFTHTSAHINAGQAASDEETLRELKEEFDMVQKMLKDKG